MIDQSKGVLLDGKLQLWFGPSGTLKKTKNKRCTSVGPSTSYEQRGRVRRRKMRILICWGFRPDWCRAYLSTWSWSSLGSGPTDTCTAGQVDGACSRCIHARLQALIDKRRRKGSRPLRLIARPASSSLWVRLTGRQLNFSTLDQNSTPKLCHNVSSKTFLYAHQRSVITQKRCQCFC